MRSIIQFFAREHLLGNLLTIILLGFGIFALTQMRRDIWPQVEFNVTTVTTVLPGASPEQIEKLIVNPVEEALREVEGLKKVFSTAAENTGVTVMNLDPDARDPDKINQDIRQAVDQIEGLPDSAEDPVVAVVEANRLPVIEVTVAGEDNISDLDIRKAAKYMSDKLSLLPLVSSVTDQGMRKREFLVEVDPIKMSQRKIGLNSLIQSIQAQNISLPGGTVENNDGLEMLVKTEAEFGSPEDIKKTVIKANESGFRTTVGDVADVTETLAKAERKYRANGKNSVNVVVAKKQNGDTFELINSVKDLIQSEQKNMPDGVTLGYSNDFSVYLSKRLNALSSNLIIGLGLVILVLMLFLPWQVALVVACGIPVALFSTFLTAHLFGISLNLISLIGLIIVLGMLVDDAIVVSENVWRHVEEGDPIFDSVVNGTREVFGPVLASVLTTVSAFGPMLFMTGIFGAFVYEIPLMVILALVFSLLEAFIIMPSHFTSWVAPLTRSTKATKTKSSHWFDGVVEKYQNFVSLSLRKRYWFLGVVIFLLIGTIALIAKMGFELFPGEGNEIFFVKVETPRGTTIDETIARMKPLEKIVAKLPKTELKDYVTSVGIVQQDSIDPQTRRGSQYGQIRVGLTPQNSRDRVASEIIQALREEIGRPEGVVNINFEEARQGPPQGRDISINILGENFEVLKEISVKVEGELKTYAGVVDIQNSFLLGKDEWQVLPDPVLSASVGLTAGQISQTVRAAFEGIVASAIRELDEEIDVRVKLEKESGEILSQLKNLKVGNPLGNLIPLGEVAEFKKVETRAAITHYQFKRQLNISAGVEKDKNLPATVIDKVRPKLANLISEYPGYEITYGGEEEDTNESFQALGVAFLFAAFVIFALLIITFKNLIQPLLVVTSIPLGFMGVAIAMFVHNRPFSFMAMLGVIALAGVIVNNAIVFTDFVNGQRKKGKDLDESIVAAAKTRLRPIMLTTITTVCGLLPTAYGDVLHHMFGIGGGDPFIVPIALSLGWGMAFGSLLTAIFFPSLIRIVDDIRSGIEKLWLSISRRSISS